MIKNLMIGNALAAAILLSGPALAHVATIDGEYDAAMYDTPDLVFHNTSGFDFTNVQLTLTGYQGTNTGVTQSRSIPDIIAGTDSTYIWTEGFATNGNLFTYDYDDSDGAVASGQPGNFEVTFTAIWDGQAVFSQFSPTTNATGGFVGWEGLDQDGFAESVYDAHNGTVSGTLAYIDIGLPPAVPEPATWAMMIGGLGLVGGVLRQRNKQTLRLKTA